jgi:spore germination protein
VRRPAHLASDSIPPDFGDRPRWRIGWGAGSKAGSVAAAVRKRIRHRAPSAGVAVGAVVLTVGGFLAALIGSSPPAAQSTTHPHAHHVRADLADQQSGDGGGNAMEQLGATGSLFLPQASAAPAAAPAAVTSGPPLAARENFAFAPYWTLPQSGSFSLTGLSTLAYFAVGVNPDGTLDESGAGWDGFQSQALADLVSRAHAQGERVVLTVNDFGQSSLDALTSSPTAAATLSSALIPLLQSKNLDGVNFDFEGEGSGDQNGLTALIASTSSALRAADPHWQITMDTYASSAGDPNGFYNIPALAQSVDAFFVMDYELNLEGTQSAASPLTSGAFSSLTTLRQYTAAVPASKVILGAPFFGIDWPTDNGTMAANAAGGATDIADSQAEGNGPQYWDPVTDTAWTSYQAAGGQWHESYYEGEYGLYEVSQLAAYFGVRGVGIWALGMESNDTEMISALDGLRPPAGPGGTGPGSTSDSPPVVSAAAPTGASPAAPAPAASAAQPAAAAAAPGTTTTAAASPAHSTGIAPATTTTTAAPQTTAERNGASVVLTPVAASQVVNLTSAGTVTDFHSTDAAYSCLNGATLNVFWNAIGHATAEAATPTDCITQDFELPS